MTATMRLGNNAGPQHDTERLARSIEPYQDLFTEEEAVRFLKLPTTRALRTLRQKHGLTGQRLGKKFMYHRLHLVAVAERMFGVNQQTPTGSRSGRGR